MEGICQFCEKISGFTGSNQQRAPLVYDGKIKYGVRHYAHYECFLNAKGADGLRSLHAWQVKQFPYKLLKERGLLQAAQEAR